jgi:integrase
MARINPKERERDRILSNDELRLVWAACSGVYGAFLRFLLLTAVRRSEAAGMQWSELSGSLWTIPASRMKAKAEHVVPLSAAALAILDERRSSAVPFGPIASSQRKAEFDAIVPLPNWTLHDLRRTARSLMSRAGVNKDIAERCLAHAIGGVSGVYDRHAYLEEKRKAFEALAAIVAGIVGEADHG